MTERNEKNLQGQNLERWLALRTKANRAGKKGAPIDLSDFKFLLNQGGRLTEENAPYIDNCYLSRLELSVPRDKKLYRFKTLSTSQEDFYSP